MIKHDWFPYKKAQTPRAVALIALSLVLLVLAAVISSLAAWRSSEQLKSRLAQLEHQSEQIELWSEEARDLRQMIRARPTMSPQNSQIDDPALYLRQQLQMNLGTEAKLLDEQPSAKIFIVQLHRVEALRLVEFLETLRLSAPVRYESAHWEIERERKERDGSSIVSGLLHIAWEDS